NGFIQKASVIGYCEKFSNKLCENGGTCVNVGIDDYRCVCLNGYSGKNCSRNEDDCVENSCAPGSTCIDGIAKYNCACPSGKIGLFCHLDDPCIHQPCGNGSECIADTASGEFSCNCMKGITGQNCTTDINECIESDKLCFNGGICVNTFGSWYCDCPVGYNDPYCMIHDSECEPNPCLNGASCLDYGNRYECICQNAFYGTNCEKSCPPGFESRTCKQHRISLNNNHQEELFEEQICFLHNCSSKADNNMCDSECNYPKCQYDGFDCSAHLQPFWHCPLPDFCGRVFHDNKCDPVCDRSECLFDGFDCVEKRQKCLFEDYCSARFNDGYCDEECFIEECYFDGDDCTQEIKHNKLEGNLSLIILMKPEEFLKRAPSLQFILSQGMRAKVTIAVDQYNQKQFYSWETDAKGLHGTKVYFNIEIAQCYKDANCKYHIVDMEQAANFIGARLHAAEAEMSSGTINWKKWMIYVLSGFALQIFIIAILFTLHKNLKRRNIASRLQKKVHVVGTWFPPTLDSYFPINLLKDDCESNGNVPSNDMISEKVSEKKQRHYFTEIYVIPDPEDEKIFEKKWIVLHDQAMDSFPIKTPINKSLVNMKSNDGKTALMLTALNQAKSEEASCTDVENLFLAGAFIDAEDDSGETALIMAIKAGRAEVVKCLLRFGADVTATDIHNRTALHHAASINAADIIDAIDDADCSPLMTIAKLGYRDPEAVALLIDAGADINCTGNHTNGETYKGRTALHYAVMQSNQELARYLVERGANLNIQDHMGQTPLFLAASQGHVEMVHLLVTAGARRCIPDNMDQTPEEIASHKEYAEVIQYFINLQMQNGSTTNGSGKSRKKNVKKPRIIEISPTPMEMVLNSATVSMTPESSNSSNSSSFFDRSHLSYETTTQCFNSPSAIPQQNSQKVIQVFVQPYSSMDNMASQSYNMQNCCPTDNENSPLSSTPHLEFEYYV
uniref:Notch n=1 Tax=Elaeophora elaphi TaxID=1147741 RepID=A0A0R3S3B5_9BILA